MARKILKHLRSREHTHIGDEVIPVKPLPRQMEIGEIAMNYLAGYERIYIKNSEDEVVAFYPDGGGGGGSTPVTITVDNHLDTTSENPVQNKVITNALNGKQDVLTAGNGITINSRNIISINEEELQLDNKENLLTPGENILLDRQTISDSTIISALDEKVKQIEDDGTDDGSYAVLFTYRDESERMNDGSNDSSDDEDGVIIDITKYSEALQYNPKLKKLTFLGINGNKTEITPGTITFNGRTSIDSHNYEGNAATADHASTADNATNATNATNAVNATNATNAMNDGRGNDISGTYATKAELPVIDTELDEQSTNPVQNKVITNVILENERVTAAALTKLKESIGLDNEGNYVPSGTNYIESATSLSEALDILDAAISSSGSSIDINTAIANYLELNGINGGEYYGS